jgi:Tfp pilus assembly protein PilF
MSSVDDDGDDTWADYLATLAEFERGVREHERETEAGTHLDLGVAYLEMGLLDDAEAEFKLVLKANPSDEAARAGLKLVKHRQQSDAGA